LAGMTKEELVENIKRLFHKDLLLQIGGYEKGSGE
jgi:hypothetical protein